MIRTYIGSINSAAPNPDNETLQILGGILSVKNNSINSKKLSTNHRTAYVNLSLRGFSQNTSSPSSTRGWVSSSWSPSLGVFCLVGGISGNAGSITSSDGSTWSSSVIDLGQVPKTVIWSPQFQSFFSVGLSYSGSSAIKRSDEGISWPSQSYTGTPSLYCLADSPELGILCTLSEGTDGVYVTSDGLSWTRKPVTITGTWKSMAWSAELGKFIAISDTQPALAIVGSDSANAWSTQSIPSNSWKSICWSPELKLFCAVANGASNNVLISSDAASWSSINVTTPLLSVIWSKELGAFFASGNGKVLFSFDGITWNQRNVTGNSHNSITWSPELGLLCIAGQNYTSISL